MKQKATFLLIILLLLPSAILLFAKETQVNDNDFVSYTADAKTQQIQLYWKDDKHENFGSILNLKSWLEK